MVSSLFYNKVFCISEIAFPFDILIKLANLRIDSFAACFISLFVPEYRKLHHFPKMLLCQKYQGSWLGADCAGQVRDPPAHQLTRSPFSAALEVRIAP